MNKLVKIITGDVAFTIALIILIIINLILITLPLTNTLGYEFAAVNSFILIIISNLLTINFVKNNKSNRTLFVNLLTLFLIPLLISLISSVFTMFCSFFDGLLFYTIITFPSIIIGLSIGIFSIVYSKKYHKTLSVFLIIVFIIIPILEIYFYPQVYFYSPLIGYFPGNIYDEGLSPDWKLFFHQLLISIYFLILPYYYFKKNGIIDHWKKNIFIVIIIIPVIFYFISPLLGYSTTFNRLQSKLSNSISSDNFTLYYSEADSLEIHLIALHQEYYYQLIKKKLKLKPSKKISVYLFDSREQKKKLFGAGNADVAKPWQYSIYVSKDSWKQTLKHEIAHIFSAEFGWSIFKVAKNFNAASIEGFAQAIEGTYDGLDVNDLASLAYKEGYSIKLSGLFSGFNFFKSNSLLAYNYSGAFYDYLINEYGIEKVKRFYYTGNFKNSFNENEKDIFRKFITQLDVNNSIANKNMADYYFGRLSIIQKICPRYVSDRLNKAYSYLKENQYSESEELFNQINAKVINYSAILGLSELYFRTNNLSKSILVVEKNLGQFKNTPYIYNLMFRLGNLYSKSGDITKAKEYYEKIQKDIPHFALTRSATLRLKMISNNIINEYLTDNDTTKYKLLRSLNKENYEYDSFPALIALARALDIKPEIFKQTFNKSFTVSDVTSSYALYSLSDYFLEKNDFVNSRKLASLSLRYKENNPFIKLLEDNFDKANWFFYNANEIKSTFTIN